MAELTSAKPNWLRRVLRRAPVIPVVRLQGVIAAEQRPGRLNIAGVEPLLTRAFAMKAAPAVAIVINSPGGSPVQSRLISKRIRELADQHNKPVLVFVEDAAASGGYFIAVAGDEIFVDPSSIVGSIGVIMAGFGFVEAIDKLGIERRVHTAGRNKSTLDPFLPEKEEDVERIKQFELDIHQVFIDHVKAHRAGRLKADDDTLFTGQWWTGLRGVELGLVDAIGDLHSTLRQRFGPDIELKVIAPKKPFFALPRLSISASGVLDDAVSTLEDRAHWARLGL
ncbi:MAG: S49 family peptidase [Devosia sp.]|uniref:S49 family peptidase n=1 Tax=unclassified Devosia TaxID=196773 RepID=UPI0019FBC22F|nr:MULTISPECIES: S49 family peptidase [unclassified Devosia]MBF0681035.1 S49 family peptidase [Devosia sp.]WEJ32482.1 S49 family peptidase [Devosia sp. SD17-2]